MLMTEVRAESREKAIVTRTAFGLGLVGLIVILAHLIVRMFIGRLGHDQILYFVEVQRFLSGATIYGPHLSETNPPFIFWFSTLPVLLARSMHGSPVLFLRLLVLAMVFSSVAWSVRILRRHPSLANTSAGLLGCVILVIELGIGPYDSGQREHLLIALLIPYILAAATGVANRLTFAERCALGVVSGMAIWFKPQDVLILVGLELFLSIRTRSLRRVLTPEFLSMVVSSFTILLLVRTITPLYFSSALPLLLDTYWAFGTASTLTQALSLHWYMLIVVAAVMASVLFRKSLRDSATFAALIVCSVCASFAFDIQHTDWDYHRYPHEALLVLALAYLLIDFLYPVIAEFPSALFFNRTTALAASGLMAVLLCAMSIHPRLAFFRQPQPEPVNELDQFLAQCRPDTTVYVFSTGVPALASVYNHGLQWGSRFAHLWMLPAIVKNESGTPQVPFKRLPPATLARLARLQRSETTEDLNYWHPSVVLVQLCSQQNPCQGLLGRDFNMLSWFERSAEFSAVWSHYRKQPGIAGFDVYTLDSPAR
jgi:hypothetical protein